MQLLADNDRACRMTIHLRARSGQQLRIPKAGIILHLWTNCGSLPSTSVWEVFECTLHLVLSGPFC